MSKRKAAPAQPDEKCPRCSDCPDNSHHWLDNDNFGLEPEDLAEMDEEERADVQTIEHTHICKHCTAVGNECEDCYGDGCRKCKREGVIRDKAIPSRVYPRNLMRGGDE